MPQTLNLDSIPAQRFQTTFGNQPVTVDIYYHEPSDSWFISLTDGDGIPIVKGRRLSTNNSVTKGYFINNFDGDIVPVSIVTPIQPLTKEAWGTTHTLTYFEEGEFTG